MTDATTSAATPADTTAAKAETKEDKAETIPATAAPTSEWHDAVDRVRGTNAWIVKAFSSLGVLLVGSGPLLVKFGDLPSWSRASVGFAAGAVALLGVAVVVREATRVMLPETVDLTELAVADTGKLGEFRARVEQSPLARALYLGDDYRTIAQLVDGVISWRASINMLSVLSAQADGLKASNATAADYPSELKSASARAQLPGMLKAAKAQLTALYQRMGELLEQAVYVEVRETFDRVLPKMFRGAALAAIGTAVYLGAFGIDLGKSDSTSDAESATSVSVTAPAELVWAKRAEAGARDVGDVRMDLGLAAPECDRVPVTVSGSGTLDDAWEITTIQAGACAEPARAFTLDRRYAEVVGTTPLKYDLKPPSEVADDWRIPLLLVGVVAGIMLASAKRKWL